jgi:hypothetical protein
MSETEVQRPIDETRKILLGLNLSQVIWGYVDPDGTVHRALSIFNHIEDASERSRQTEVVNYLGRMCSLIGLNPDDLKPFLHVSDESEVKLIEDRGEINKRLSALADEFANKKEIVLSTKEEELFTLLEKLQQDRRNEIISGYRNNRTQLLGSATASFIQAHSYLQRASVCHRDALALESKAHTKFVEEIKKIATNSFWLLLEVTSDRVTFGTRHAITMSYVNKEAGINMQVPLGRYKLILMYSGELNMVKWTNNITLSSHYYHPYCDTRGNICWGNAAALISQKIGREEFADIFSILASLLTTYDPTSTPWRTLDEFFNTHQATLPSGVRAPNAVEPDATCDCCGEIFDDCECYQCDWCDWRNANERCDTHYCSVCEDGNAETCGCCNECSSPDDECHRCRECDYHDDEHARSCSQHESNQEDDDEEEDDTVDPLVIFNDLAEPATQEGVASNEQTESSF